MEEKPRDVRNLSEAFEDIMTPLRDEWKREQEDGKKEESSRPLLSGETETAIEFLNGCFELPDSTENREKAKLWFLKLRRGLHDDMIRANKLIKELLEARSASRGLDEMPDLVEQIKESLLSDNDWLESLRIVLNEF